MKPTVFVTVLVLTLLVEFLLGNIGLTLPLLGCVLYYYAGAFSPGYAIAGALAGGLIIDFLYQRPLPLTAFWLLAALAAGRSLRRKENTAVIETVLPGMLIAVVLTIGNTIVSGGGSERFRLDTLIWQLVFSGAAGMALLPGFVLLLDTIGKPLAVPCFIREPRSRLDTRPLGRQPRRVRAPAGTPPHRRGGGKA